jgi:hypothetical protein
MIPILQFDPSSLAIWYDIDLLKAYIAGDDWTQEAFDAAVAGNIRFATALVDQISDRKTKARAIVLISSVVHEKQHFFDFVATNYGAMRFRQFSELYISIPGIVGSLGSAGVLHCPIEVYLDPVKRSILGIESPPPDIEALAELAAKRRRMIEHDREPVESRFGGFEIGGEALLEARAFIVQSRFIQMFFGLDGMRCFEEAIFDISESRKKYNWVYETIARSGILEFEKIDDRAYKSNSNLVEAIVFASLQGNYFGPPSSNQQYIETSYPGERLAALIVHLKGNVSAEKLKSTRSGAECWELVDETCKACFGRTVGEEISADIESHESGLQRFLEGADQKVAAKDVNIRALTAYYQCRKRARNLFSQGVGLTVYSDLVLSLFRDAIRPRFIVSSSTGVIGSPPSGFSRLMGYDGRSDETKTNNKEEYKCWWWACVPEAENQQFYPDRTYSKDTMEVIQLEGEVLTELRLAKESTDLFIELSDHDAWNRVSDYLAPISKLMLGGRSTRLMLGAEMNYAEQRLKTITGIEVSVWHSFEYPEPTINSAPLFYYCGKNLLRCDFTSEEISEENAVLVSPWEIKSNPQLAKKLLEAMGGTEFAYYTLIKDWSYWLISKKALPVFFVDQ